MKSKYCLSDICYRGALSIKPTTRWIRINHIACLSWYHSSVILIKTRYYEEIASGKVNCEFQILTGREPVCTWPVPDPCRHRCCWPDFHTPHSKCAAFISRDFGDGNKTLKCSWGRPQAKQTSGTNIFLKKLVRCLNFMQRRDRLFLFEEKETSSPFYQSSISMIPWETLLADSYGHHWFWSL